MKKYIEQLNLFATVGLTILFLDIDIQHWFPSTVDQKVKYKKLAQESMVLTINQFLLGKSYKVPSYLSQRALIESMLYIKNT